MKNITYHIALLLAALTILFGCDSNIVEEKNASDQEVSLQGKEYKIKINRKKLEPQQVFEIIASDPDYYSSMTIPADHTVTLMAQQRSPLVKEKVYSFCSDRNRTKTNDYKAYINNILINKTSNTKSSNDQELKELFGTNVTFSKSTNNTKSTSSEALYIPEIIHISAPRIEEKEDLYPLCDYSNFVLRWNKDANNANGVFVFLSWHGTMAIGEQYSETSIERLDVVPDSGEVTLNPHLFDNIPDAAVCTLYLGRGASDIYQIDEESYKIIGESHEALKFILIREIRRKQ